MFSCEFCEISKITVLNRTPPVARFCIDHNHQIKLAEKGSNYDGSKCHYRSRQPLNVLIKRNWQIPEFCEAINTYISQ